MTRQVAGLLAALALVGLMVAPSATAAAPGLAITVPSVASFGERSVSGGSFSAKLGPVKVTTSSGGLLSDSSWITKVSTSGFTSVGGVIPPADVGYSAGLPTSGSGVNLNACIPGSAPSLVAEVTAMSCSGLSLLTGTSVTWNPTITIQISDSATVGIYSGTITHSVA